MKNILLIACLIVSMVFDAEATNCWDPAGTSYAGTDTTTNPAASTHCTYTHAYGPSGAFTNTMWPTWTYSAASALCTTSSTTTCIASQASSAAVTNLPTVSSCYTGTALTATTLTTQAQTACTGSNYFCKGAFTIVSGAVTAVTSSCTSAVCTPAAGVLCSMVANTNQVFGCYTGAAYATGTSTWAKTICPPVAGSPTPYVSAAYCKNVYTWTSTNGLTITGSCETSCTAVTLSLTGTTATAGTTCSGTVYGNTYSGSDASININMIAMVLSSIMGLFAIHF